MTQAIDPGMDRLRIDSAQRHDVPHGPAMRLRMLALPVGAGLVALAAAVGGTGWAAIAPALAFAAVCGLAVRAMPGQHPHARMGAANGVTLLRAAVACLLVVPILMPGGLSGRDGLAWGLTAAVWLALALDGVDGWLARRQGTASAFGARFDMEVDALLAALLAVLALVSGKAGLWVLILGFMRYGFVAAMRVWPWLDAPLPDRAGRKTVCVLQIATLATLMAPPVVPPWSALAGGGATVLLIWSFGADIVLLRAARR